FLDARSGIDDKPLGDFVATIPSAACFVGCQEGETSYTSGALNGGIWTHHVIEALAGRAPLALEGGRLLTPRSLQEHLAREVPRTLRATFREAPMQTPMLHVSPGEHFVIADVEALVEETAPTADPRLAPLKRGS